MQTANQQKILKACDQCVLCGLCLPHCPTYQLEHNECESPRGRIVLIQALMRGDINQKDSELTTLDHCLLCRSCEAVCPSRVPYGEIIALARDEVKLPRSRVVGQLMDAVAEPQQMQGMLTKLKLYQKSGMQRVVRGSGLLRGEFKAAEGLLKFATTDRLNNYYPAKTESMRSDVQLFTGCMGEPFDQQTVRDTISLLNRLGFGVKLDHPASCCGAMHYHNGDVKRGDELKRETLNRFSNTKADVVVALAGSCVARLNEGGDHEEVVFVIELTEYLAENLDRLTGQFSNLNKKIAVHQPCPNKNLLKNFNRTIALLNQIPGLEIVMLPTYGCCGASGTHMVSDAEHARMFLADTVKWLVTESPDLIVSQNMGCMLHIASEIERQNMNIDVIHPISLLLKSLTRKI